MFKIQVLNNISQTGLSHFPSDRYHVGTDIQHPDAILVRSQDMHHMTIPPSVKVVGRAGVGVNNIPVDDLTARGIPVLNTPGANANAVRELVIAGMLLACRNISHALHYVNELNHADASLEKEIEANKKKFVGFELYGKTLGVIGLGNVGVKVANSALSLGMRVIGYDPTISIRNAWELSSSVIQSNNIDDLAAEADFITLHIPMLPATKHLIDQARLKKMKPGIVLLNFAREALVDNQALLDALENNHVFAYVTDFPCPTLKNHPNVISLPHLGASTREAEENCAEMAVRGIKHFLEYGSISHSVNFPSVDAPQHFVGTRLMIVNANVPNMVAQISAKLGETGININSLINKSRDDIAYTIVDTEDKVDEAITKGISTINGVIQLRKIDSQ